MNLRLIVPELLLLTFLGQAQTAKPLTPKEACAKFMPAVVRIDVADGRATGFIISPDGWILTAAHVVFDPQTGERRSAIAVLLPDGSSPLARVFIDKESAIRDFAILKISGAALPFLELGANDEIAPGSDITIIGYPFSAESAYSASINTKFCLSGLVAATDSITKDGVNVDAIYFQGPAVKGISGGPIIARDTGHVVGIQSQRLAGIGQGLDSVRSSLRPIAGGNLGTYINNVNFGPTVLELINVLDRHLANGLGAATGIDDPKSALSRAKKDAKQKR